MYLSHNPTISLLGHFHKRQENICPQKDLDTYPSQKFGLQALLIGYWINSMVFPYNVILILLNNVKE